MSDPRPAVALALRSLREGSATVWVTLYGERLRLALPDAEWLAAGVGTALVATRRGYRVVDLSGRRQHLGRGRPVLFDRYAEFVADKRVRAIVLERHLC